LRHPFERWPRTRRRLALVTLICAAILPLVSSALTTPLAENEAGGRSIVDFELAGSPGEAREIIATWESAGVLDDAKNIQLFDIVYPLIYCSALAGACVAAAGAWRRAGRPSLSTLGIAMAWAAFAGALFDYVENIGLAVSLWGHPASPWPQLSLVAGVLKFATTGAAFLYALTGLAAWLLARRVAPANP
jgi:hypothetical protein